MSKFKLPFGFGPDKEPEPAKAIEPERERQEGGCGDPRCDICYNQRTGELNAPGQRYSYVSAYGPTPRPQENPMARPTTPEVDRLIQAVDNVLTGNLAPSRVRSAVMETIRENVEGVSISSNGSGGPNGRPMSGRELMDYSMRDAMQRASRQMLESMVPGGYAQFAPTGDAEPVKPDNRAALAALEEAREPIKDFIIDGKLATEWEDVIGNERARIELREAIEAATTHADLYSFYDRTPPKGVLLFGPPGCGKTMFGKATATAVSKIFGKQSELLLINGAEIESPILSIAAKRVAAVFKYARAYHAVHGVPVVIFIDEADAVLCSRKRRPISTELVSAFLAEMDGLKETNAFIILATNQPEAIDEALLRDGRIDRKVKINRPTLADAKAIIASQIKDSPAWVDFLSTDFLDQFYSPDYMIRELVNPETRAKHHFNMEHIASGAMIVGLLARGKAIAFRRDLAEGTRTGVTEADMLQAVNEVFAENKDLPHDFALKEFVTDVALPAEALKQLN